MVTSAFTPNIINLQDIKLRNLIEVNNDLIYFNNKENQYM